MTSDKEGIKVVQLKGKIKRKNPLLNFVVHFSNNFVSFSLIRLSKRAISFLDIRYSSVDQCPYYCGFDERPLTKIMAKRVRS